MDDRETRLAQNEALFREVNERVNDLAPEHGVPSLTEYLCECANPDCTFRIRIDPSEYEVVRRDPRQFIVLPLHFTPEIEVLTGKHEHYWTVRKTGEAGEYVEHLDPRSR